MSNTNSEDKINRKRNYLILHYGVVSILYFLAIFSAYKVLSLSDSQKNLVSLLSIGAIIATFGSAIGAIGLIFQSDLVERVKLNVDILFNDILNQESPWRRWPFLPRSRKKKLLDGSLYQTILNNPEVPLEVGTHVIKIDLPTILEDFFDLPVIKNWWKLCRNRKAAHTFFTRNPKGDKNPETGLEPSDTYMAYECMYDTWKSILKFRIARYFIHFGSGLTISGACIVVIYVILSYL